MNKYLKDVTKEISMICKELELSKIPTIIDTDGKGNFIMGALCTREIDEYTYTVLDISSDYEIYVNQSKLRAIQNKVAAYAGDDRVKYEVTLAIIRHELRHVWQHENKFSVGLPADDHDSLEKDADKWMIKASKNNKERVVAEYIKALHGNKDTSRQILNVVKAYRPMYGMLHSTIYLCNTLWTSLN